MEGAPILSLNGIAWDSFTPKRMLGKAMRVWIQSRHRRLGTRGKTNLGLGSTSFIKLLKKTNSTARSKWLYSIIGIGGDATVSPQEA
ncbi:hypothetical protein A7K93_04685 [Candidatus Methylacidiphilum fumarolicum]|jgi:hypothetical protein|nr:hypothetical protein A7K73_04390 [Candidatus Methylacidiphilum fumarolicum]TFE74310.1 hypothetical protein A7K93_04685 [Candidatus Methylacidiphilum fumarolicum]TFE75809.1 hypothetical protein A7K72_01365 [Candidatus Methylacidiphilum fumarolicum]TFE75969.1 hypothetical protein A7D33_01570 [Candidatus Methylacidiphilum fumarolicum]